MIGLLSRCLIGVGAVLLGLAGCASGPPAPLWHTTAVQALARANEAYLTGQDRVAALELGRARSEVARTGNAEPMARVELSHCAARVASLVFSPCSGFDALQADAPAPEQAYARYLLGQVNPLLMEALPAQHRPLAALDARANPPQIDAALQAVPDPLARLVAAGVLLRRGRATPGVVHAAVQTASAQGWRRPLLAWLGVQQRLAREAGDTAETQRLQRWQERVGGQGAQVDQKQ